MDGYKRKRRRKIQKIPIKKRKIAMRTKVQKNPAKRKEIVKE
jgi:hypothetical protein